MSVSSRWRQPLASVAYYAGLAVVTFVGAVSFLGMFTRPWYLPLSYRGDALSGGAQFKATMENGWYEYNPDLGAPHGLTMHPFPLADNLQFAVAHVLGWFIDQWSVAFNLAFLLSFPAAALTAAWFARKFGVSRSVAFVVGVLFAFAPYHFRRGLPHLSLSLYFVVPLIAFLVVSVALGHRIWARREGSNPRNPIAWATPTTLRTLVIVLVAGSTSSYYAVFGGLFLGFAILIALAQRRVRAAGGALVAGVALLAVMLANMAPDILWARSHLASPGDFARKPIEAEIYAFKFTSLIFPTPWTRFGGLAQWRVDYDATFPNVGEGAVLGMVATVGFLGLLVLPIWLMLRGRRTDGWFPSPLVSTLSFLTWVGLAFGVLGGLSTVFALLVSPDIRAWNRINVYLSLFALTALGLAVDRLLGWMRGRWAGADRRPRVIRGAATAGLLGVVLVVGLLDQVAPPTFGQLGDEQERWDHDRAYVDEVEDLMPAGTMVLQLPAMGYPESPMLNELEDYELVRPYLHSRELRWSYGAVKGRPTGDWTIAAQTLPPDRLIVALASAGFTGVHIDRLGFPARDASLFEDPLTEATGEEPVTGAEGRYAFYDLREVADEVERTYSRRFRSTVANHLVLPVDLFWQRDFWAPVPGPDGRPTYQGTKNDQSLQLLNVRREPTLMRTTFTLRADGATGTTPITVQWPDGEVDTYQVPVGGHYVHRRLKVPRGTSEIRITATGVPTVSLVALTFTDPVLNFEVDDERTGPATQERGEDER